MSHPVPACLPAGRRPPPSSPSPAPPPPRASPANFWHRRGARASELRPPGARGEEGAPRPAPSPARGQPRRNRDHKYAARSLGAAQPARRPPRVLIRAAAEPSRAGAGSASASTQPPAGSTQAPHARTSEWPRDMPPARKLLSLLFLILMGTELTQVRVSSAIFLPPGAGVARGAPQSRGAPCPVGPALVRKEGPSAGLAPGRREGPQPRHSCPSPGAPCPPFPLRSSKGSPGGRWPPWSPGGDSEP